MSRRDHSAAASFEHGPDPHRWRKAAHRAPSAVRCRFPTRATAHRATTPHRHRPGLGHRQPCDARIGIQVVGVGVAKLAGQRGHQPAQRLRVEVLFAAGVDQHTCRRDPVDAFAVRLRQLLNLGTVLTLMHRPMHIHAQSTTANKRFQAAHVQDVSLRILAFPGPKTADLRTRPAQNYPHKPDSCGARDFSGVLGRSGHRPPPRGYPQEGNTCQRRSRARSGRRLSLVTANSQSSVKKGRTNGGLTQQRPALTQVHRPSSNSGRPPVERRLRCRPLHHSV